jgi:hypothetical protein
MRVLAGDPFLENEWAKQIEVQSANTSLPLTKKTFLSIFYKHF